MTIQMQEKEGTERKREALYERFRALLHGDLLSERDRDVLLRAIFGIVCSDQMGGTDVDCM
jgi:hypothetical protein